MIEGVRTLVVVMATLAVTTHTPVMTTLARTVVGALATVGIFSRQPPTAPAITVILMGVEVDSWGGMVVVVVAGL